MEKFQGWTATLSNGENVWESPPVPGERYAWQKLITRLNNENLKITSLRVQRGRVTLHALSQKACDGYYQAYDKHKALISGEETLRQGCGSVIGDKVFIQWIDENGNVWSDIRPFEMEKPHTTLRDT